MVRPPAELADLGDRQGAVREQQHRAEVASRVDPACRRVRFAISRASGATSVRSASVSGPRIRGSSPRRSVSAARAEEVNRRHRRRRAGRRGRACRVRDRRDGAEPRAGAAPAVGRRPDAVLDAAGAGDPGDQTVGSRPTRRGPRTPRPAGGRRGGAAGAARPPEVERQLAAEEAAVGKVVADDPETASAASALLAPVASARRGREPSTLSRGSQPSAPRTAATLPPTRRRRGDAAPGPLRRSRARPPG